MLRAASNESDDPARAVAHMLEVGELYETQLADDGSAISAYESVLAIDPDAVGIAAQALERLYDSQQRWADLTRLLERRALQAEPAEALALRRRRAEILADKLDALDDAAEELELLSADNPEVAEPGLLDCWNGSTRGPSATTTSCARCSGKPTPPPPRPIG